MLTVGLMFWDKNVKFVYCRRVYVYAIISIAWFFCLGVRPKGSSLCRKFDPQYTTGGPVSQMDRTKGGPVSLLGWAHKRILLVYCQGARQYVKPSTACT